MKILYIHQYFKTPEEGGAIRSYYLAKGLVDKGHEVEMITSWNQSTYQRVNYQGIVVHYLPIPYDNRMNAWMRMMAFIRFVLKAIALGQKIKQVDVIYATSTPLTTGWIALRLKKLLQVPFYFEVRDLWPEAPIQMGYLNLPGAKKLAFALERLIYRHAEKIIALSPGIQQSIVQRFPEKTVHLIPNMADCAHFSASDNSESPLFSIGYTGAAGRVNALDSLLRIAHYCQEENLPIHFKILADGADLPRLKTLAYESRLNNLAFYPFGDKQVVKAFLDKVQAVYVSFADKPILQTNSPNKYFDGLAAGKLIVVNIEGWLAEMAKDHRFGFFANPYFPAEFVEKIKPFMINRDLLKTYQNNAREVAENYFSIDIQVDRLIGILENKAPSLSSMPSQASLSA
ncbi:glycosyltransferase family 4 protein [Cytophagales bacterium LB-30]|uniref:Glycosyltransferase family 4 protein n=1 Tax=Shiella aurantiaca TaxID=3058365 RepID=A0ABT8F8B6_9BACT|nr:glycosyltransferase family 4 protein [Shiella aurantiaca]MDN4166720.1 glycosyltransferase family 4 protein [Shiella aurantiaca]